MQAAAEPARPAAPVTVSVAPFCSLEPAGGGDDDVPVEFVLPPSAPAGAFAEGAIGGAPVGADGVGSGGDAGAVGDEVGGADAGEEAGGGAEAEAGGGAEVGLGALGAGAAGSGEGGVAGGGLEAAGGGDDVAGAGAAGDEGGGAAAVPVPLRPARTMTMSFSLARQLASTPLTKKKAPAWSRVKTVLPSANFLSYDDVLQAL